jgi:hypothetical protein
VRGRARRVRGLLAVALVVGLAGCPGPDPEARVVNDRDTMTQRQRDSVTATLPVPGAGVLGDAMDAADAAAARAAQHDSLAGGGG